MKIKTHLPDKPSALLIVALTALRACENDHEHYEIRFNFWHSFDPIKKRCYICLALAAITQKHCCHINLVPYNFSEESKLLALDMFARGNILAGLSNMGFPSNRITNMKVTDYKISPKKFYEDMDEMVKYLQTQGL